MASKKNRDYFFILSRKLRHGGHKLGLVVEVSGETDKAIYAQYFIINKNDDSIFHDRVSRPIIRDEFANDQFDFSTELKPLHVEFSIAELKQYFEKTLHCIECAEQNLLVNDRKTNMLDPAKLCCVFIIELLKSLGVNDISNIKEKDISVSKTWINNFIDYYCLNVNEEQIVNTINNCYCSNGIYNVMKPDKSNKDAYLLRLNNEVISLIQ